ncbi:MAG: hypothetical protein A4E53_04646 [Pelotomaculum sp. PtaB.Bin104]|nr:MAG: hypothetical protein A4E53_04646 [Pelotomaculum sp. PtaB.Bin104]
MFLDIKTQKAMANFAVEFDEQYYSRHKDIPIEHLTKSASAMMDEMNLANDAESREYWRGLLLEKLNLERDYTLLIRDQT